MDLKVYLKEQCARVDAALDIVLPKETDVPGSVHKAMRYSVFAGGKRLRPILALAACQAVGGDTEAAISAGCAMEMIHTYSLIHDDLPSMDNDDYRRGKLSCHKAFDEATAILAGDALLNKAFEVMLSGKHNENYIKAVKFISDCSGINGMIKGQALDLSLNKNVDEESLIELSINKTSKLIVASMVSVGIYFGVSNNELKALNGFSENYGIAFQISDDILDFESKDSKNFAKILGLSKASEELDIFSKKALDAITTFRERGEFFVELIKANIGRKG